MTKEYLENLEKEIIEILQTEVKDIIVSTRQNMVVVEEKPDGDSATIADIKIGEIFEDKLIKMIPNSIVIQEESFNEEIYKDAQKTEYIWVIDPIDGTKAFRDLSNYEWCVGVCLLENLQPILSFVYIPENWLGEPYLLSANKFRECVYNFGEELNFNNLDKKFKYVSHIHKDFERNDIENKLANLFENNEIIRAYAGHSTLAQFAEIAINKNKVFTRRSANIWDIIQSAYLIQKTGGDVFYEDGESIFPLKLDRLKYENNHLLMQFTIGCLLNLKDEILKEINK